ncbi:MAG: Chaperone protein DnaJ [Chloroflexi bacterium ADurb.Bin325]|nr:MAG: Chaperone protein DnaJ [Chloroflexi bacterium ADurb.Bin325]
MSKRDYYEVLGVGRDADENAIKSAYRRLARQHHPDVNKSDDAEERFKEINEAYEVLSDADKRAAYDRYGHAATQGGFGAGPGGAGFGGFPGFGDIFEEFFGGMGGMRSAARGPARGADLRYDLEITFQEAVFGAEKEIEIPRQELCPVCQGSGAEPGTKPIRCPQCNGTGEVRRAQQTILGQFVSVSTCPRCNGEREIATTPCTNCRGQRRVQVTRKLAVNIPAGVDDGMRIRLAGEGEPGERGGPTGNLFVVLHVKPHPLFQRQENDILLELPVNIVQAALGAELEVPTLDGTTKLTIPAGTQHGEVFRLRGKGVPILRSSRRGDQLVGVRVVVPEKLNDKQRKLLNELGESLGLESLGKDNRSLFEKLIDAVGDAFGQ